MLSKLKYVILSLFLSFSSMANAESGTLVLLVDVSSSISNTQMKLQFDSYRRALSEIAAVRNQRIVVITFGEQPAIIANGSYLEAVDAFSNYKIIPPEYRGLTCLTFALHTVDEMLRDLPKPVIIDISGDGQANCAWRNDIPILLDKFVREHQVRVNSLFVINNYGGNEENRDAFTFYNDLRRNNGFTITAESFEDFELSIFEKITMELSALEDYK